MVLVVESSESNAVLMVVFTTPPIADKGRLWKKEGVVVVIFGEWE